MATTVAVLPPVASSEATGVFPSAPFRLRVFGAVIGGVVVTACGQTPGTDTGRLYVFSLTPSIVTLGLVGALFVLVGIAVGTLGALHVLRNADTAIVRHQRAVLARVFHASQELQLAVEESLAQAHRRVDALRSQLARMQETTR